MPSTERPAEAEEERVGREDKRQIWILYELEKPRRTIVARSGTGFSRPHWRQQFLDDNDADDAGRKTLRVSIKARHFVFARCRHNDVE